MLARVVSVLSDQERRLFYKMVADDMRPPKDEIRWLILREAERRGLVPTDRQTGQAQPCQTNQSLMNDIAEWRQDMAADEANSNGSPRPEEGDEK